MAGSAEGWPRSLHMVHSFGADASALFWRHANLVKRRVRIRARVRTRARARVRVRVRVSPLGEEGGAPHVDVEAATSPEALAWLGLG